MNNSTANSPQGQDIPEHGDIIWTENFDNDLQYGPSLHSAYVYVVDNNGTAYYRHKNSLMGGKVDIGGEFTGPPVIVEDYYFVATTEKVVCYDKHLNTKRWETTIEAEIVTGVTVAGGRVFVGLENGTVRAIEAATGRKLWNVEVADDIANNLLVYKGDLLVTAAGDLFALDPSTGAENWQYNPDVVLRSAPAPENEKLFFANKDGEVHSADYSQMEYGDTPIENSSYDTEEPENDWQLTQDETENTTSDGYGGVDDPVYNMTVPTAPEDRHYSRGSVGVNTEAGHIFVIHGQGGSRREHLEDAESGIIPEIGAGNIYYPSDDTLKATPYDEEGDGFTVEEKVTTSLTISDDHIYFGSGNDLVKVHVSLVEPPASATYYGISGHNRKWKHRDQTIEPLNGESEEAINESDPQLGEDANNTVSQSSTENGTSTTAETNTTNSTNQTGSTTQNQNGTSGNGSNGNGSSSSSGDSSSTSTGGNGSGQDNSTVSVPESGEGVPEKNTGAGILIAAGKVILAGVGTGASIIIATFGVSRSGN